LFGITISNPKQFVAESQELVTGKPPSFLTEQLSLADQTSLAEMVHALAGANQIELERLAHLPVVLHELETLRPSLDVLVHENEVLSEINAILQETTEAFLRPTPRGAGSKSGLELVAKHNELMVQAALNEEQLRFEAARYEEAIGRLRGLDRENAGLEDKIGTERRRRAGADAGVWEIMERAARLKKGRQVAEALKREDSGGARQEVVVTRIGGPKKAEREEEKEEGANVVAELEKRRDVIRRLLDILDS
jgi:hypothetical protein